MTPEERRIKERARYARMMADPVKAARAKAYRDAYNKKYLHANRVTIYADNKARRVRDAVQHRIKAAEWKRLNPDKHKAHVQKARAKYQAKYPERILMRGRKSAATRRMRMAGVVGDPVRVSEWTEHWRKQVRAGKQVHCAYCTIPVQGLRYFWMDHVIPVSLGGPDLPENLVPACRKCNGNKHDRLLCDWVNRPHTPVRWSPLDSEFGEALRCGDVALLLASLTYRPVFVPEKWESFLA